jgi:hypothetical protein
MEGAVEAGWGEVRARVGWGMVALGVGGGLVLVGWGKAGRGTEVEKVPQGRGRWRSAAMYQVHGVGKCPRHTCNHSYTSASTLKCLLCWLTGGKT